MGRVRGPAGLFGVSSRGAKMKIKTVCRACGLKAEGETEGGSLSTWCSKSGWGCYMDVSNGLTFVT